MKLTPLDIRHREFRRVMRGYADEEVDVFLDDVADEFERLFQENIELQEKVQRLEDQVSQLEGIKETLQKTLISAQQQADETRANARKEAELVMKDADLKSRDIVNESYREKQAIQQSLIQLKQVEEDFRFKFRSLLEAHLNLLSEDERSDDRREFRGLVADVEAELSGEPQFPAEAVPVNDSGLVPDGAGLGTGDLEQGIRDENAVFEPEHHSEAAEGSEEEAQLAHADQGEPSTEGRESAIHRFFGEGQDDEVSGEEEDEGDDAGESSGFFENKRSRDFEW